jgi:hypothetical protein
MKSFAVAVLVGAISAQEITVDLSTLDQADEDNTLFNPIDIIEDFNKPEPTDPCCHACSEPLEKYYSVDHLHGNCGEACMDPSKYWLYKLFEPGLAKDDTSNEPCKDRGYDDYQYTPTHGAGPIKMTLDLYGPHKNESLESLNDVQDDCVAHSSADECHADSLCSWCTSGAVKPKCNSVANAKALPASIFACDNLGMIGDDEATCAALSDEDSCNGADPCSWCKSAAVKSKCNTIDAAKSLPASIFSCSKLSVMDYLYGLF